MHRSKLFICAILAIYLFIECFRQVDCGFAGTLEYMQKKKKAREFFENQVIYHNIDTEHAYI